MEDTELQENDAIDQAMEEAAPEIDASNDAESEEVSAPEPQEETRVPVSAVQKERRKRQEAEAASQRAQIELQYYKEQMSQKSSAAHEEEEDTSQYESATRAELRQQAAQIKEDTMRDIEERLWKKANPEKSQSVDENLAQFLKQRPNLASAISSASNRYEEAYMLMEALTPREQAQLKAPAVKKVAPGSPVGVPKAAGVNQAVDLMSMSDEEYRAWRQTKKRR